MNNSYQETDFETDKRKLLEERGFLLGNEDITAYFSKYHEKWGDNKSGDDTWSITSITKRQVVEENDLAILRKKLFQKDSVQYGFNCTESDDVFEHFADSIRPFGVAPSQLDPYIAGFVRAINEIGVRTLMSCDGWHEKEKDWLPTQMQLWMRDRYSVVWLWVILEFVLGESWNYSRGYYASEWNNKWEPDNSPDDVICNNTCKMTLRISRGKEGEIYQRIEQYRKYIEKHREELLRIREKWIHACKEDDVLMNEMKTLNFMKLRKRVLDIIQQDIVKLHR